MLAGDEFTAAGIMMVFTLTTMRLFYPVDLGPYANIRAHIRAHIPAHLRRIGYFYKK